MKKIRLWFRTLRALRTWIWMSRKVNKEIETMDPEHKAEAVKLAHGLNESVGVCVLTLLGIYPLHDNWDIGALNESDPGKRP